MLCNNALRPYFRASRSPEAPLAGSEHQECQPIPPHAGPPAHPAVASNYSELIMRYLVALLFCRPRTLNSISPVVIESSYEHGRGGTVDPKGIDNCPPPGTYCVAIIYTLFSLLR